MASGIDCARRRCIMEPMPRIPPVDRPATYEDLMKVPDTMVAEIVDAELYATPRPALPHAHVTSALGVLIGGPYHHGRGGPGGWWILDEPELHRSTFAKHAEDVRVHGLPFEPPTSGGRTDPGIPFSRASSVPATSRPYWDSSSGQL